MQGFPLPFGWLKARGVRLSDAGRVAVDAQGIHGKHELCRRIRRLALKDRKGRSAAVLERLLADSDLAVMVRLEAARALERFRSPRLHAIVERLLASSAEIPALKGPLQEMARRSDASGLTPMPAFTADKS